MKKISILFFMILMMALSSSVSYAGGYNSLKFTSNSGETYVIASNDLEILIEGENLKFNNTDVIIPLSSLVSMEFGDFDENLSIVDSVIFDRNGKVMVYNVNGAKIGSFNSYSEALDSLGQGLFVIKDSNGNSLKVNVEK